MKEFLTDSVFFGAVLSFLAYEIGLLLKKRFKLALLNPLLIGILWCYGSPGGLHVDYDQYNGGAQYISYLLTPATVCLAVPLYEQLTLLKKNFEAVAAGILSGTVASLGSVYLLARLFRLNHEQYVTLSAQVYHYSYRYGCFPGTGRRGDHHGSGDHYYRYIGKCHC